MNTRAKTVTVTLLPSGVSVPATLTDTPGWQEVRLSQPEGRLDAVELRVDGVYPGTKYSDLCLSDVEVYVTATTPDNPALEKAKLDRVLAWKKSRVEAAALFKSATAGQLPLAPAYTLRAEATEP